MNCNSFIDCEEYKDNKFCVSRKIKRRYINPLTKSGRVYDVSKQAKKNGDRIISVGTTSTRTLEAASDENGMLKECSGWTDIFIYPGYSFKVIDCLITNFHLPQSTLVMLVSALAGREHVLNAYKEAVEERYRFFSFGDAMFIE